MMSDAKRLHPATIILNIFKPIKEMFFLIVITFITLDFIYFLLFLLAFLLLNILFAGLSWYRFIYWVTEDALQMEYGVFRRTKRTISKNRIQSIDLTENIVHRIFKLVRVQIETASSGTSAEASLPAVKLQEGEALRAELKYRKTVDESAQENTKHQEDEVKKEITFQRLLLAGVTSGGIGVILGIIALALQEVEDFIPDGIYDVTIEWFISSSLLTILLLIVAVLFLVWLLSIGLTLIRYGKFTIKLQDDELLITRGLIEKKQLTIPLHRIQAIGVEENIFRQPFGYASIVAELAGGSSGGGEETSTVLFPLLTKNEIPAFLEQFIPGFSWRPEQITWTKPPKSALKYYIFRSGIFFFIVSLTVFFLLPAYTWVALMLLALMLLRGWMSYRDAGFYIDGKRLFLRYRVLKRVTVLLYNKRVQAFEKKQHVFQRKDNLASMRLSIISNAGGKHYHIKDLEEEKVHSLSDLYFHE